LFFTQFQVTGVPAALRQKSALMPRRLFFFLSINPRTRRRLVRLNRCQLGQSNMQKFAGPVRGLLAALAILALGAATLAKAQDRGIQASLQTSKDAAIANASAHMRPV
jgi:hypothetical protein